MHKYQVVEFNSFGSPLWEIEPVDKTRSYHSTTGFFYNKEDAIKVCKQMNTPPPPEYRKVVYP